jgi:hypothetical protein
MARATNFNLVQVDKLEAADSVEVGGVAVNANADLAAALETPAAYTEVPAEIAAILVDAGLMEPDDD